MLLAAPLIAGNDLSRMSPATLKILTNRDVIAIDQDPLGKQGGRIAEEGMTAIYSKPLSHGAVAVGLFNRTDDPRPMTLPLAAVGMGPSAKLHDIWANGDVTPENGSYSATVPGHGVVLLRVAP